MVSLLRGFVLYDPRKSYPGFYLSPQQSYVLSIVNEAGDITPGEVARLLHIEKSHLTKIVNSMIHMGAVKKVRDVKDRRRQLLTLTKRGQEIYRELNRVSIDSYVPFMEQIPEQEREGVIRSVEIMREAMEILRKMDRK